MTELVCASDDSYSIRGLISCEIQGTAICHLDGKCSKCAIALAYLNPEKPLYFCIQELKK